MHRWQESVVEAYRDDVVAVVPEVVHNFDEIFAFSIVRRIRFAVVSCSSPGIVLLALVKPPKVVRPG